MISMAYKKLRHYARVDDCSKGPTEKNMLWAIELVLICKCTRKVGLKLIIR